jgi:hypothetical protein
MRNFRSYTWKLNKLLLNNWWLKEFMKEI